MNQTAGKTDKAENSTVETRSPAGAETDQASANGRVRPSEEPAFGRQMDRLSLNQALIDVEIANLRAIDLTQRLLESAGEGESLKAELKRLKQQHEDLSQLFHDLGLESAAVRKHYDELLATKAYKLVKLIWGLRRALNV